MLEELYVSGWQGFGTAAACEALAGLLRSSRSLTTLRLAHVGLTGDGLGHIAAALRAGSCCKLKQLGVSGNRIGGGDGARHLADIVALTATLESLGMFDVGLDVAGGEMIANALLENRSLEELAVGWERDEHASKSANAAQSAALARILNALTPPVTEEGSSSGHSSFRSASHTPNIKTLWLRVYGNRKDLIAPELRCFAPTHV